MMKAMVYGAGLSGKSAAYFLQQHGYYVIGVDRDPTRWGAVCDEVIAEEQLPIADVEFVVRSPGVSCRHPVFMQQIASGSSCVTDMDLAFQYFGNEQRIICGVTGTNGKTTTVLFLQHLLSLSGHDVVVSGNIGVPVLEALSHPGFHVVEMSSFQLEAYDEAAFHCLDGGAILNLNPNHLDYHGDFSKYARAKHRLRSYMKNETNLWSGTDVIAGKDYRQYLSMINSLLDKEGALKTFYLHDKMNYCAAYALAQDITHVAEEVLLEAMITFKKPPHRLEYVGEYHGVHYINDSKATSVDAVKQALRSVPQEVIVILGGRNKGHNFQELRETLRHARQVIVMGESRWKLAQDLSPLRVAVVAHLEEAVKLAKTYARPGDTVLLSPGCASFDLFSCFEQRGNRFKELVQSL